MNENQVLYYLFHCPVDFEFCTILMQELGDWMFIHSIRFAACVELFLYLVVLLFFEIELFKLLDYIFEKGCKNEVEA